MHDAQAGLEVQRPQVRGPLPALRKDPYAAAGPVQQVRTRLQALPAALRAAAVQRQGADPAEKGQRAQVAGIHHRPAGTAECVVEWQQQQRVPPGDVVGHEDQRPLGQRGPSLGESAHPQPVQPAGHPPPRVRPGQPQEGLPAGVAGPSQRLCVGAIHTASRCACAA